MFVFTPSSSSSFVRCLCCALAAIATLQVHHRPVDAAAVPLAVVKAASQCSGVPDAFDCLLRAAAAGVHVLARSAEPVDLVPGCVSLVKNTVAAAADEAGSTEKSGAAAAVVVPDVATSAANDGVPPAATVSAETAFVDSVTAFAKSRAISVRAPAHMLDTLKNTLIEARGKKNKMAGPLLMGAMMVAGTLLPIKLGALAMMSGKALMTSMLALMLSAILALKKLASGGGGHSGGTTYEVINVPAPHGPPSAHGRSLAHSLAYGLPVVPTTATEAQQ